MTFTVTTLPVSFCDFRSCTMEEESLQTMFRHVLITQKFMQQLTAAEDSIIEVR